MRIWKSFGISFFVYFITNLGLFFIIRITNIPAEELLNIRILPPGYDILYSVEYVRGFFPILEKIFLIIVAIVPGLFGSIFTGKISNSKKEAFSGWMITITLSGIILIALYLIYFNGIGFYFNFIFTNFINSHLLTGDFIFTNEYSMITVVMGIFIIEILTGLYYSIFALLSIKRN